MDDSEYRGYALRIAHRVAVLGGLLTGLTCFILGIAFAAYGIFLAYTRLGSAMIYGQDNVTLGACISGASYCLLAAAAAFGVVALATRHDHGGSPSEARELRKAMATLEELRERIISHQKDASEIKRMER